MEHYKIQDYITENKPKEGAQSSHLKSERVFDDEQTDWTVSHVGHLIIDLQRTVLSKPND